MKTKKVNHIYFFLTRSNTYKVKSIGLYFRILLRIIMYSEKHNRFESLLEDEDKDKCIDLTLSDDNMI